ncbi:MULTISPECIES: acyltransferase [unclassified Providencia]|uniref:acyltransferase n=1 Tax=unclassified Providencia TaxID=2633465 RepID=UPI00234AB443|nr:MULTISPECIES: acyltransferase [unclassified Providencia]
MRDNYWDNWKGIAIIAVVSVHVLGQTSSFSLDSFNNLFGVFLRQFVNFCVALFFFLSGYFTPKERPESNIAFYKKRISKIFLPYLVWTFIYTPIHILGGDFSVSKFIYNLIFGTGVFIGYFVIALIQLVILTPFLYKLKSISLWVVFIGISLCFSIGYTYYFQLIDYGSPLSKFPFNGLPFFIWLPFYLLGFYLSKINRAIALSTRKITYSYILLIILSLIEAFYWLNSNREFSVSQLKVTTYLTSVAVCLYVISTYKPTNKKSYLTWLGENSYFIYLSHLFVMTPLVMIFRKVPLIYNNSVFYYLLMSIFIIILCALMKVIAVKLLSAKIANKFLG